MTSPLLLAIQLHQLDWPTFSALFADLPHLPGKKSSELTELNLYELADVLLLEDNIAQRLSTLNTLELCALHHIFEQPSTNDQATTVSKEALEADLATRFDWASGNTLDQTITNILHKGFIVFEKGQFHTFKEVRDVFQQQFLSLILPSGEETDSDTETQYTTSAIEPDFGHLHPYEVISSFRELLRLLSIQPIKIKATGEPMKSEVERLQEHFPNTTWDLIEPAISFLITSNFGRTKYAALTTSTQAEEFYALEAVPQWHQLVEHWQAKLPKLFIEYLLAHPQNTILSSWASLFPHEGDDRRILEIPIDQFALVGRALGVFEQVKNDYVPTSVFVEMVSNHPGEAVAAIEQQLTLPEPVLYLQNDLTAIATGPLPHEDDALLVKYAKKISHSFSPNYRFSQDTLRRAWHFGRTPEHLRQVLTRLSETPIPPALDYLIDDSYRLAKTIVIRQKSGLTSGSTIVCADDFTRQLLLRDTKLCHLSLKLVEQEIHTPASVKELTKHLAHAGHFFTIDFPEAQHEPLHSPTPETRDSTPNSESADTVRQLWDRLQKLPAPDQRGFMLNLLSKKGINHPPYVFTIDFPEGIQKLSLQPLSLAGNRLRVRDVDAETERTIPVSRIRKIQPLEETSPQ